MMTRALQLRRLRSYLRDKVLPCSAFYRELFAAHRVRPEDLRTWADLDRIPFTSKTDLLSTPDHPQRIKEFVLQPDPARLQRQPATVLNAFFRGRAAVKAELEAEYQPIFLTSTTGRSSEPVTFLYSQHDLNNLSRTGYQMIDVFGNMPNDRVLNMFPFAPHLAFWQTHYATTSHRIFSISSGGGKSMGTEGNIRLMKKSKPTALIGMPTFLYHFLRQAADEGVRAEQLRLFILGGEKVPQGLRQKLRGLAQELGAQNIDVLATYGFTEAKMAWAECPTRDGNASGYHLYPDHAIVEIVDPATGKPQPDGTGGEIVFTALDARGTAVIRYRTGDCIDGGITCEPCPHCGRTWPRLIGDISRRSDVLEMNLEKLKGTVVDLNEIERVLDELREIGSWQLELRKRHDDPLDIDELILHAEKSCDLPDEQVKEHVNETFSAETELRLNDVFFHTSEEMRRRHGIGVELKEKRVVDHRPKDGKPAPPRS